MGVAGLALTVFLSLPGCNCVGDVVFIPDAALDSALRAALGKPFGCLTRQDLQSVVELQAAGLNIRNLQGLENCTSLTVLNLRSNRIQSISPLANLINLTHLDLGDNRVTNIEALAGLVFLQELNLYGDAMEIYNWSPLVANAVAGGGLGAGDVVILPTLTTLNDDNTVKEYWLSDYNALVGAGVTVLFADGGGSVFGL
jgi:hypothetical protein